MSNGIDFESLYAGAEKAEQDREEQRRLYWEEQNAKQEAKDKEFNALLGKVGESITTDNQARAKARIEEETAKAQAEIVAKANKDNNIEDKEENNLYKNLLKGLGHEED